MTRNEFCLLNAIRKDGVQSYRSLSRSTGLSIGYLSSAVNRFIEEGFISGCSITDKGFEALEPYRVENAIIMAAGMSSRFVPISWEKPKGLLNVKGEVLIERQIEQLREAGIQNIVLVLGYKKESFFYLADKYDNLKIIINPRFDTKNNAFTIYLAQQYIGNSFICSSDNYFTENPFDLYVYQSYYASIKVETRLNEWYMIPDRKGNIKQIIKNDENGYIMMGHVYWNRDFSRQIITLINQDQEIGKYDTDLWEQILADNLKILPPMRIEVYPYDVIHEFDSLEDLRMFDSGYINNTNSKIMKDISSVIGCEEKDIKNFITIKKGLTNTSVCFEVDKEKYVYRYSYDREGCMVNRSHEKRALELAKLIGINPVHMFIDESAGWTISQYVNNAHSPDYNSADDVKRVADSLRHLHEQQLSVNWSFLPWEEIRNMELLLKSEQKEGINDSGFNELKESVRKVCSLCCDETLKPCFCHCDAGSSNWLLTEGMTVLIDWEYAGNADTGCDIGAFILDSGWEPEEAKEFIRMYCGTDVSDMRISHYLAYTSLIALYWYVWALYRESIGAIMGEGIYRWRRVAKQYSQYLIEQCDL